MITSLLAAALLMTAPEPLEPPEQQDEYEARGDEALRPAPPAMQTQSATFHTHDGFQLRLELGPGYVTSEADGLEISGGGAALTVMLGGAITDTVAIGGIFWGVTAQEPEVKMRGLKATAKDTTHTLSGFGPYINWYLMPANLYLTAAPLITQLSMEMEAGGKAATETGFGLRLGAGWEAWIDDDWGLGVSLFYALSSNKDKEAEDGSQATMSSWTAGLSLSATYN